MRRPAAFILVVGVALCSAPQRLPAPVNEEPTATVAPKPKPSPKPKPKPVATLKPKATPISFAGTWTGVTDSVCNNDGAHHSYQYTLTISADERLVSAQLGGNAAQYSCYRSGDMLRWDDTNEAATSTTTLRISADGKSVSYSGRSTITTWPLEGVVCTGSGTLMKR
jgi:hypothetical protein